jgi:tRNA nucleotidyltransferase/poly(A) polymerase
MTSKELFEKIAAVSKETGFPAYIVGGYVRDQFLNLESKDIDFVIVGDGIAFAKQVKRKLRAKNFTVYNRFGTAKISIGDFELEFVGARKESYSDDSRKPDVEATDLETDLSRRDFSINAMAIDVCVANAAIIDPFNGQNALRNKLLITPLESNVTFDDDPLRILRAIRFATRLNFTIADHVFAAMKAKAARLSIVSKERVMDELSKTIAHKNAALAFRLLAESGVLAIVFPIFEKFKHDILNYFNTADYENLSLEERLAACCVISRMIFDEINTLFRELKFSNQQIKQIQRQVLLTQTWKEPLRDGLSKHDLRHLLYQCGKTYRNDLKFFSAFGINFDLETTRTRCQALDGDGIYTNFTLALNGKKVMELRPDLSGKAIGDFIKEMTNAVLDGNLENTEEALASFAASPRQ